MNTRSVRPASWALLLASGLCVSGLALVRAQQSAGGATQTAGGTPPSAQTLAQSPVFEGTAAVSGVVTDADTKEPIPGVMVYLGFQGRGAVGRLSRQVSDAKGRFVFTDLPAGNNFFINASKFGYLDGHFGVGAGGLLGGLITLTDGQWFRDANVVLSKPGSISGTVLDERGEPAVGVFVRVLPRVVVAGRSRLTAGQTSRTDDRGMYRLADLAPGKYVVQVPSVQQSFPASLTPAEIAGLRPEQVTAGRGAPEPPAAVDVPGGMRVVVGSYITPPLIDGRPQVYPPAFHPGVTTIAAAAVIELRAGEHRSGINVALRPVPAASIAGTLEGPPEAVAGAVLRLIPDGLEELGLGAETATTIVGADGRFTFVNVPSGSYTVDTRNSINEITFRSPLATAPLTLPATPGLGITGSSSGSVGSAPYGTSFSVRQSGRREPYFAQQRVSVDGRSVSNLVVTLRRGSTIRGKFVMENGAALPSTAGISTVYVESADASPIAGMIPSIPQPPAQTPSQGPPPMAPEFTITGIGPGQFFLRFVSLPGNGMVQAITSDDGLDHRVKPFDTTTGRDFNVIVTVTTRRIDLTGTVNMRDTPTKHAVVIAFPVNRDMWANYGFTQSRARSSPTSSSGTYRFQSLPAGDYYLAAVPADQATIAQEPAMLAKLAPLATRLTLAWGDVKVQDLSVVKVQ